MVLKSYKYRLYPNLEQRVLLNKTMGCVRYIYNWGLDAKIKSYQETKKSVSLFELCNQLPKLRKDEATNWLKEVNAQSLQMSLRNLDNAYTNFFRNKKGFPKFKKKNNKQSFQCPQRSTIDFENNTISIIKIKNIKCVIDRKFDGKIKTVTISKTPSNKYFASILVETNDNIVPKNKPNIDKSVGVDLGLKHFITLSTGEKVNNPKFLEKSINKIKLFSKRLKRNKKGSKRYEKTRLKLAKIYELVSNKRNDFLHKLSTKLIRENQSICLEDLNAKGMVKNHCLARSISSASWSKFVDMLKYKSEWYGVNIIQIGKFDPSSKMCSCGKINNNLKLEDRMWRCEHCNIVHDRDILAANNIKNFAFDRQNLIENLKKNRAGLAQINAHGDDKVHVKKLTGGRLRNEKFCSRK